MGKKKAEEKQEGAPGVALQTAEDGFPAFLEPDSIPDGAGELGDGQGFDSDISNESDLPDRQSWPIQCTGKCAILLEHRIALGNGTLEAGTVLGEAERDGGGWILEETATAAEGITEQEFRNALNNPHIIKLV